MTIKDLYEFAEENKFEENEFPKDGDEYWYIHTTGKAFLDTWDSYCSDEDRLAIGNIFKTKEEAEFEVERLKVIAELKRYAEPKDREWNGVNQHYYLCSNTKTNELIIADSRMFKSTTLNFESIEKAKEAVEKVGEDRVRRFYLGWKNECC